MKRLYISKLAIFAVILFGWNQHMQAQTLVYSQSYTGGSPANAQCTAWTAFAATLLSSYNYTSVTLSGSNDPVGHTTTDPIVTAAIANALRTGANYSTTSGGFNWLVNGSSGDGLEITNTGGTGNCNNPGYTIRPCISVINPGNTNWGGINGPTCGGGTQTMILTFHYQALLFTATSPQSFSVCENSGPTAINSQLATTDPTTGLTETWSVNTAAVHGSLGGFPTTGTTTSGTSTPTGLTYTPTPGYSGVDSFKIQATDGTSTAVMRFLVTVNATPAAIGGIACVVQGQTTALSETSTGGVWSSNNSAVASIVGGGIVTGATLGTATISYLVGAVCPATVVVSVNSTPSAILGSPNACTGVTSTLIDGSLGGSWSSSNPSAASVDAFGNVTGVSIGGTVITYTLPSTCIATLALTVNGSPGPITGSAAVCQGSSTPLSDAVGGGTWVSTATSIANVGSTGIVTGISPTGGVSDILYTLPSGCASSLVMTVDALPTAFLVSGTSSYCFGASATLPISLTGSTSGISYQLFNGPLTVGLPVTGGGLPINFGLPGAPGVYSVVATNPVTGCMNTMTLTATVTVKPLPIQFTVTQVGSSYCQDGSGVEIGLNSSTSGVVYTLWNGVTALPGTATGTGTAITFGLQTLPGSYTVTATTAGCTSTMIGAASVTINPLPNLNNVTGGGSYCSGASGVAIGLDFSNTGISYQLFNGATPQGSAVAGTGGPISFGFQTVPGSLYSVTATNTITGCVNQMTGTTFVNIAIPPNAYNVIGGGTLCAGGSGFPVIIDNSDPTTDYQLYNGTTPIGGPVPGLSAPLNFGVFTDSGTYTVVGTDITFHCVSNMAGSAIIRVNPLPIAYNVTGGGSFCAGGLGLPVTLSGSQIGISYSLYYNLGLSGTYSGTGGPLNFGTFTNPGSYTVVASNAGTSCINNMAGAAIITINPLPLPFNFTGGGNYCAGGAGIDLGLDFSTPGINYQLYNGLSVAGAPIPGTGSNLDFGNQTAAGTYTIVGINPSTGCSANMSGNGTITINPLPVLHSMTGGGSYCTGDAGRTVGLSGSDPGMSYQLYNNAVTAIGSPIAGTGAAVSFGLQTLAGTYTVVATDTFTLCTRNMSGVATVVVNALPGVFTVSGGGVYCDGAAGMSIGLSGSNAGVHYLLYNGSTLESTVVGAGSSLNFGLQSAVGTYTVTATNTVTGCSSPMDGNALIEVNPSPTAYAVIGGGGYCVGSSSIPSVGIGGSDAGVNYQLYRGGTSVGAIVPGTGAAVDFGTQSTPGVYTVVATDGTTGCVKNMPGSAVVTLSALPTVYAVTGGGGYCIGASGLHIYMSISNPGIEYKLLFGGVTIDSVMGSGAGVDFGLQSAVGAYTAIAVNPLTGCTANMSGSATITINSLPASHTVTVSNAGNYCATGTGVHVGLDGSNTGINYQLYNGLASVGGPLGGTGLSLDFGTHTSGNYTIVATNATTGCTMNMTGSAAVHAIPLPNIYAMTGGGNYCATGLGLHIGLNGSDISTQYQLYHGSVAVGIPVVGTGGTVDFGPYTDAGSYTVAASNGGATACTNNMSGSATITVYPVIVPSANISTPGGDTVCVGSMANFTASVINGGTAPTFAWSVNGVPYGAGSALSYLPVDGDMVSVFVHSNGICAIPDTATETIRMTVSPPELPSVHVAAAPGDVVCQSTSVTYTATSMFSGFHPTYTWLKNGVAVAGSGLSFTYTPTNNDIIVLMMGSDFPCRMSDTVFSNPNRMKVDPPLIPKVTITANPGTTIGAGQTTTLTANLVNGGSAPTYQWKLNGVAINGATTAIYSSSSFQNNDSVTCEVTGGCDLQGFNSVRVHITNVGVAQVTGTGSDNIKLIPNPNKGLFTVKGTLATSGDEEVTFEVTNMLGQVLYSRKAMAQSGNVNETIQLSGTLPNGMYLLNLRSDSQNNVFHFVIEQ